MAASPVRMNESAAPTGSTTSVRPPDSITHTTSPIRTAPCSSAHAGWAHGTDCTCSVVKPTTSAPSATSAYGTRVRRASPIGNVSTVTAPSVPPVAARPSAFSGVLVALPAVVRTEPDLFTVALEVRRRVAGVDLHPAHRVDRVVVGAAEARAVVREPEQHPERSEEDDVEERGV